MNDGYLLVYIYFIAITCSYRASSSDFHDALKLPTLKQKYQKRFLKRLKNIQIFEH